MPRQPKEVPDLMRAPAGETLVTGLDWAAAAFSLIWLAGVGLYVWAGLSPKGAVGMAMTALVVVLPLALAWFTVATLKAVRGLRAEAARLKSAMDTMRVGYSSTQQQVQAAGAMRIPDRVVEEAKRPTDTPMSFTSRRDGTLTVPSADRKAVLLAPRAAAVTEDQPGLALGTPPDDANAPLEMADFLHAVHFPEGPDDVEGIRALRLALADRTTAKLIRAAQDVLTLLAQEGIYMDDLSPDRARPELWRQFASGARGRSIAGLGGIRDRSCLALTASRMREDAVFRDAAHHFLRSFDKAIASIEPGATDAELSLLSDTRTARAFMLFGRVTGTFD